MADLLSLKQKVMSGLAWSAGGRFLAQLITWAITIIVIRLLSPEDYGLMSLSMVFVSFLAMLNELGLGAAVIQSKNINHSTLRSLFGLVLIASLIFYFMLAISSPLIAEFYEDPRLISLILILSLQFLFIGLSVLPQSLLLREMKFRQIAIVDFLSAIAGSITTLALALAGFGVWALAWGSLMNRVASMIGLNIAQPFFYLPSIKIKGMWKFFSFGGYVTFSRIIWYVYSRTDVLIIGKVLGKELLGFYSVGLMLASLPMDKVSGIISRVAFPAFSSVQTEPWLAGQHFLKAVRVISFFSIPVLWGISSIAPEIIEIFLGEKWVEAALPMQLIALVIPLRMISSLMTTAATGVGRPDINLYITLYPLVLMPPAFFVGSYWGLFGVSLAWILIFPIVFCLETALFIKSIDLGFNDVLKAIQLPFLSGLFMYCGVYFLKIAPILQAEIMMKTSLLVCCGAVIYILMSLFVNRNGVNEVRALVKI